MVTTITLVHEPSKAEIKKLKTEAGLEFYQVHLSPTNGDNIYLLISEESLINLGSAMIKCMDNLGEFECSCVEVTRPHTIFDHDRVH